MLRIVFAIFRVRSVIIALPHHIQALLKHHIPHPTSFAGDFNQKSGHVFVL